MRKLAIFLLVLIAAPLAFGQTAAGQWTDGAIPLDHGWRVHDGDNPAWAAPNSMTPPGLSPRSMTLESSPLDGAGTGCTLICLPRRRRSR